MLLQRRLMDVSNFTKSFDLKAPVSTAPVPAASSAVAAVGASSAGQKGGVKKSPSLSEQDLIASYTSSAKSKSSGRVSSSKLESSDEEEEARVCGRVGCVFTRPRWCFTACVWSALQPHSAEYLKKVSTDPEMFLAAFGLPRTDDTFGIAKKVVSYFVEQNKGTKATAVPMVRARRFS